MISLRSGFKGAVERALVFSGRADASRRRHSSKLLVLAYHNIVPHGSAAGGDRSLHLSQQGFGEQLDSLLETHDVTPLGAALAEPTEVARSDARPRVAITFDDAYTGAMTAGVQELRARSLPATVFVTPAFIGGSPFWWDVLASPTTGLDERFRERALNEAHGLNEDVLALARSAGMTATDGPAHARGASESEIDAALSHGGLSLAAQTWRHPNLTSLADDELARELAQPLEWLRRYGDRALPMISYPYGLADNRVMRAARDAGYAAAFMIAGGWTDATPQNRFAIPRLNVPAGVSRNGFVLRASGMLQG